jgi:hypothetical protein
VFSIRPWDTKALKRCLALENGIKIYVWFLPGNPYLRGRLSTVDSLVITSLDQLLVILNTLFTFYKTRYLNEEVSSTEPSPLVDVPFSSHTND